MSLDGLNSWSDK